MRPSSLPAWCDWDSLPDASLNILLPRLRNFKKIEFRNRGGPNDGLGGPQYVGSSAIVYAEHEVVFLQSDQADRAIGTWIDIPLHMNPLMRANEGYKGMTAREALGVANGG